MNHTASMVPAATYLSAIVGTHLFAFLPVTEAILLALAPLAPPGLALGKKRPPPWVATLVTALIALAALTISAIHHAADTADSLGW